ncbi:capsular biosynthesis protein [Castellaniella ginsengisoli]|jgi:capsular polysaccharide export protein|uniref:Capsular biosynthesis protein n=1 Tax=Castellaniella ginsengisoli TaxID=546114 RepID=A0AB39CT85_9BURK
MRRTFLFLQGPCTPFFRELARALRSQGHCVRRVNFTAGDLLYWRLGQAVSFRGRLSQLPSFYEQHVRQWGVTDVVLFGDCRPVHRPAVDLARRLGLRAHVFEEGYFRPHRITLERGGVNAHSPLMAVLRQDAATDFPPPAVPTAFKSPFWRRAMHDVTYHVAGVANPVLFPFYRNHARYIAPLEYLGYAWRLPLLRWYRGRDDRLLRTLLRQRRRFFVLPLQLDGDSQIRQHSPYGNMRELMDGVLASFARHAPADAVLVVKNHPLDPGLARHGRVLRRLVRHRDLRGRVFYMETGQLPRLLRQAAGVVTVNSTVGPLALEAGLPLMVLGRALYAQPGLVHQGDLDSFWTADAKPDAGRFRRLRQRVLAQATVNGGFYCPQGIALAVRNSLPRLLEA